MANQEKTSSSRGRESEPASTSGAQSGAQPGAPSTGGAQAGGAQAGGAQAGGAPGAGRPEQERPMELSREGAPAGVQPGESARRQQGTGMQQGMQQGMQRGGALSQPQSSLLPAFFANPGLMASAFMANPFEFAEVMTREMDRIFENFGPGTAGLYAPGVGRQLGAGSDRGDVTAPGQTGQRLTRGLGTFTPQIELLQRGNEVVVRADLPGLRPEDVQVEVERGMLTISGERRNEFEDQREGYYRTERRYGSFQRTIPLPEGVNEDEIRATFEHGVLEVAVPVRQQPEQRGRRIQVQPGGATRGASLGAGQGATPGSTGAQGSSATEGRGGAPGSSTASGSDARRNT